MAKATADKRMNIFGETPDQVIVRLRTERDEFLSALRDIASLSVFDYGPPVEIARAAIAKAAP